METIAEQPAVGNDQQNIVELVASGDYEKFLKFMTSSGSDIPEQEIKAQLAVFEAEFISRKPALKDTKDLASLVIERAIRFYRWEIKFPTEQFWGVFLGYDIINWGKKMRGAAERQGRKAADGTLLDKKGFPIAEDNTELVGHFSLGKDSTMKELSPIIQISLKRGENILTEDLKLKTMKSYTFRARASETDQSKLRSTARTVFDEYGVKVDLMQLINSPAMDSNHRANVMPLMRALEGLKPEEYRSDIFVFKGKPDRVMISQKGKNTVFDFADETVGFYDMPLRCIMPPQIRVLFDDMMQVDMMVWGRIWIAPADERQSQPVLICNVIGYWHEELEQYRSRKIEPLETTIQQRPAASTGSAAKGEQHVPWVI